MSGQLLDQWLATLDSAGPSVCFASVNMRVDGTWKVNLSPKGRSIEVMPIYAYPYLTREKAMEHVERWARCHWRSVPRGGQPPGKMGW